MISVKDLSISFASQTLLDNVSIQFNKGNRYGLVGANGSGKSTFLKILAGLEVNYHGSLSLPKEARVGILKQDHFIYENNTPVEVVIRGNEELWQALTERDKLLAEENPDGNKIAELEDTIVTLDGYSADAASRKLLTGLGITPAMQDKELNQLSGGFKLRVLMAQLLFTQPEVLLLDEPTNHLDIISIRWLENYIKTSYKGTAIIVSHDRNFINRVCNFIADVDYQTIILYKGDYDDFMAAKSLAVEQRDKEAASAQKKIDEMQAFVDRFRAKATKARQAQSRVKQIEKVKLPDIKISSRRYPTFDFRVAKKAGKLILELKNLSKSYGKLKVLEDVSFSITRGDKVAIIGPNGIGKSTLLKSLVGLEKIDSGSFEWGFETEFSYFAQDIKAEIKGKVNVYDWLHNQFAAENVAEVRKILGLVLFSKEEVLKPLSALSGGEAARLVMARIMLEKKNVLLIDEPTNHLDVESIETLENALLDYSGTLVFVSHDTRFIENIATRIIAIHQDHIIDFDGSFSNFVEKYGEEYFWGSVGQGSPKTKAKKKKLSYEEKKQLKSQVNKLKRQIQDLENDIEKNENEIQKIEEMFASSDFYQSNNADDISNWQSKKSTAEKDLQDNLTDWENLQKRLKDEEQELQKHS